MFLAACTLVTLSACSSDGGDPVENKPTSTSPSPTVDAKEAKARGAVLTAYAGMRQEQTKAYAVGKDSGTKLNTYASDKALAKIEGELFQYRQAGVVFKGKPKSVAKVTAIDLAQSPHKATVSECFITTDWTAVKKDSGKNVTSPNQVHRYTVTGSVRTIGDRWMVVDYAVDKQHTC